jgi:hypothetical protein
MIGLEGSYLARKEAASFYTLLRERLEHVPFLHSNQWLRIGEFSKRRNFYLLT